MSMLGGGATTIPTLKFFPCQCLVEDLLGTTVESLLTDTPNKGHCIKYLSTMDTTKSPNFNPPINIMQLEYLKTGQSLYSGQST